MPNIRSQTVLPDGFEIDSTDYGKRRVAFLELGGNDVRLTLYVDDAQTEQETLSNPSLTQIYQWVGTRMFPGATLSAEGKTMRAGALYVSWHIVQRNPLQLKLRCDGALPPENWWQ